METTIALIWVGSIVGWWIGEWTSKRGYNGITWVIDGTWGKDQVTYKEGKRG